MSREICGECTWHDVHEYRTLLTGDAWICNNEDSDYYCYYTMYTDTCECFEQGGVE